MIVVRVGVWNGDCVAWDLSEAVLFQKAGEVWQGTVGVDEVVTVIDEHGLTCVGQYPEVVSAVPLEKCLESGEEVRHIFTGQRMRALIAT